MNVRVIGEFDAKSEIRGIKNNKTKQKNKHDLGCKNEVTNEN